jgi:hypothetical protein
VKNVSTCCKNCDFARYTVHNEKVGCAYWSAKYYQDNGTSISDEKRDSDMLLSGLNSVWIGWVYLKRRPEKEESTQLGEGIMTNFCVITGENDCCNKFEERK